MRRTTIAHEFVEFIPGDREEGVLYISTRYRVATHSCFCGCGRKVVTPLSPAQWALVFDGATVSLVPSIGNWQAPCRSHYWIQRDRVRWGGQWSKAQIAAGRDRDLHDLELYLTGGSPPAGPDAAPVGPRPGRLRRAWGWLTARRGRADR